MSHDAEVTTDRTDESAGRPRRLGEWAIAVALLAIGVVVLLDGLRQPTSTSASGVGAGFVPTVVGAVLIVLAAALCVQIARGVGRRARGGGG